MCLEIKTIVTLKRDLEVVKMVTVIDNKEYAGTVLYGAWHDYVRDERADFNHITSLKHTFQELKGGSNKAVYRKKMVELYGHIAKSMTCRKVGFSAFIKQQLVKNHVHLFGSREPFTEFLTYIIPKGTKISMAVKEQNMAIKTPILINPRK